MLKKYKELTPEQRNFVIAGALFVVFLIFTLLVKVIDVKAIGPEGSKVGWAAINGFFMEKLPYKAGWYTLSKVLGYLIFVVMGFYAFTGAKKLVQGRSLKAVDRDIIMLGIYYVIVLAIYVFFNKVAVNYRPVILDAAEGLEASYPSSHTFLSLCVMCTGVMLTEKYLPVEPEYIAITNIGMLIIAALTVIARFLSGVHWFTDIIGGLILSASLIMLMYSCLILPDKMRLRDVFPAPAKPKRKKFSDAPAVEEPADAEGDDEDIKIYSDVSDKVMKDYEETGSEDFAGLNLDDIGVEPMQEDVIADTEMQPETEQNAGLPEIPYADEVIPEPEAPVQESAPAQEQPAAEQPEDIYDYDIDALLESGSLYGDDMFDRFGAKSGKVLDSSDYAVAEAPEEKPETPKRRRVSEEINSAEEHGPEYTWQSTSSKFSLNDFASRLTRSVGQAEEKAAARKKKSTAKGRHEK